MQIENISNRKIFEQIPAYNFDTYSPAAHEIASLALQVSQLTQDFAEVQRVPRYQNGERENDVEHSYMLALTAREVARTLGLNLNMEKVMGFALVHDLIEIETGDVPTFNLSAEELALKEQREQAAREKILHRLPPWIAADFTQYEKQDTPEAVLVRMIDKLLPVAVDVTGQGARVMREDYGITSRQEMTVAHDALHERIVRKFGEQHSPEILGAHALLCATFVEQSGAEL